jgi:hypothetical protein
MLVRLLIPGDIVGPFDETPDWEEEDDEDEYEWFPHEGYKLAA